MMKRFVVSVFLCGLICGNLFGAFQRELAPAEGMLSPSLCLLDIGRSSPSSPSMEEINIERLVCALKIVVPAEAIILSCKSRLDALCVCEDTAFLHLNLGNMQRHPEDHVDEIATCSSIIDKLTASRVDSAGLSAGEGDYVVKVVGKYRRILPIQIIGHTRYILHTLYGDEAVEAFNKRLESWGL